MALCIELVHNLDWAESSRFTTDLGQHPPSDYVAGRDLPLTVAPLVNGLPVTHGSVPFVCPISSAKPHTNRTYYIVQLSMCEKLAGGP